MVSRAAGHHRARASRRPGAILSASGRGTYRGIGNLITTPTEDEHPEDECTNESGRGDQQVLRLGTRTGTVFPSTDRRPVAGVPTFA